MDKKLKNIIAQGESDTLEFKKSTAQLRRATETLCGMLNGNGGMVLIGVTPNGRIVGQAERNFAGACTFARSCIPENQTVCD